MHPGRSFPGSMADQQVRVLVVDVGGTNVKMLVSGEREWRRFPSGPGLTASATVSQVKRATADWEYDVISLGYPGPVVFGRVIGEPPNLARGWIRFDFPRAFALPVNIVNDAALPGARELQRRQDALHRPRHRRRRSADHRWHHGVAHSGLNSNTSGGADMATTLLRKACGSWGERLGSGTYTKR